MPDTITPEITPQILSNDIRLHRAVHKGSFLLLEGDSDTRLFQKFVDEKECCLINCFGRPRLIDTLVILDESDFSGVVGFADKDYADCLGLPAHQGALVFSDFNDIEISILCSPALANVIREFGNKEKADADTVGGESGLCEKLFDWASTIGALRLWVLSNDADLRLSGMKYKFESAQSPEINLDAQLDHILARSVNANDHNKSDIQRDCCNIIEECTDQKLLCKGHDCVRILGRALRKVWGDCNEFNSDVRANNLAKILRLSFEYEHFKETDSYTELRRWEQSSGYVLFQDKK